MRRRIIWLEFYAPLELFLRCRPVPIVIDQNMRQRRVRFGECVIQCQRLYCRFFCLWHCFVRRGKIVKRQASVGIRQADVAKSEIRIALDALLEVLDRLFDSIRSSLVPKIAAAQVRIISLNVLGRFSGDDLLLLPGDMRSQLVRDGLATSLSTEKMSVSLRSNVSAQTWESLAALISWTLTRTASPLFWTLPSRM